MGDRFKNYDTRLDSPLAVAENVTGSYAEDGYTFTQLPRAVNCSEAGTLVVTMGSAVTSSIHVVAGLNPYRIKTIHSGSSAGSIVGMY